MFDLTAQGGVREHGDRNEVRLDEEFDPHDLDAEALAELQRPLRAVSRKFQWMRGSRIV